MHPISPGLQILIPAVRNTSVYSLKYNHSFFIPAVYLSLMILDLSHERFMKEALKEAEKALARDEVPVGAVVVCEGQVIARAHNLTEMLGDPTAHAEMQALTAATSYLGGKYLEGCTIYITLEPCTMCAGALYWARPDAIVYGARDEKRGYLLMNSGIPHPRTKIISGILKDECSAILKTFFQRKR